MGSKDRRFKAGSVGDSFVHAYHGIRHAVRHERNIRIHLTVGTAALTLGMLLLSTIELVILIIVIGLVVSLELINTALERLVDLATEEFHPLAKAAKDVSAAAVLVFVIAAVIIGLILFTRPLLQLFIP